MCSVCAYGAGGFVYRGAGRNLDKIITVLKATIDTLQGQLAVKDKQIEELNARLAESSAALVSAQQTVQAAQALHAGTIQQQITEGNEQEYHATKSTHNMGIFKKFFRKK